MPTLENKEQQDNTKAGKTGFPKELRRYLALHESGWELEEGLKVTFRSTISGGATRG